MVTRFSTGSDAEVIVHLRGHREVVFRPAERHVRDRALGRRRSERVLARDSIGKKPLYYADLGDALLFGSELKALVQHPRCPGELDFESLTRYLALEYVPTPRSIFEGINKLPGGHLLAWRDGRTSIEQYWDLTFDASPKRSDDDYAEELRLRLREAVRRRLVSDVPLGAFFSGGINSSRSSP